MSIAIATASGPPGVGFVLAVSVIVFVVVGATFGTPIGSFVRCRFGNAAVRRAGGDRRREPRACQPGGEDGCTCREGEHSCPNRFAL